MHKSENWPVVQSFITSTLRRRQSAKNLKCFLIVKSHPPLSLQTHLLKFGLYFFFKKKRKKNFKKKMLSIVIIVPSLAGFLSSLVCKYDSKEKPPFQPPSWVFPVVWNIIYLLYGTCAYLALTNGAVENKALFLSLWIVNLLLNVSWTPVFACGNSLNRSKVSLWMIVALVLSLLLLMSVTVIQYRSLSMTMCLVPYLTWLFVAFALNLEIVKMRSVRDD